MKISRWYRSIRIVRDNYAGFEVQVKYIWFPFWVQLHDINTHKTLEQAREYAERFANKVVEVLP